VRRIDDSLLERAGLNGLPAAARDAYIKTFQERLVLLVGVRLTDLMTDEQLGDFERLMDGPRAVAQAWLHVHFPHYPRIVREEYDRLVEELTEQAGQIVSLEAAFAGS